MKRKWRIKYNEKGWDFPDVFWETIDLLKGKDLAITVDVWKPYTSNQQYGYYYGVVLELISRHTGFDVDELDVILKEKFLYEFVRIGSETVKKPLSKTKCTTQEFSEYVEKVIRWASKELDLVIPDPDGVVTLTP